MFRIGDFSRTTQVTGKALRHYDHLGRLKPPHIDPESTYRPYCSSRLPQIADDTVPAEGRVVGCVLPAVEHMATVIHHGSVERVGDGYRQDGPERVVLLQRGGRDRSNAVAELQHPATPRD